MPLPLDAVGQAVGAATWLVGVVAERLVGDGVAAWAARHGLGTDEISRLRNELRRANLVLGAARAGGSKVGNEQLAEPIMAVRRLAADARNLLDELDYIEIQDKIKDRGQNFSSQGSSKAQSFIQVAYGFANQTSKYISSAVKINAKVSAMHKEDDALTAKRKIERHDIVTGIKRMKLAESDDKIIPERKLDEDTVADETPEKKLSKDDISWRITNIVDQLHEICEDVRKALKQEKLDEISRVTQNARSNSREEGACYVETKVFAREHEKNQIGELITISAESDKKTFSCSYYWYWWCWKTTLARTVYNGPTSDNDTSIRLGSFPQPTGARVVARRAAEEEERVCTSPFPKLPMTW